MSNDNEDTKVELTETNNFKEQHLSTLSYVISGLVHPSCTQSQAKLLDSTVQSQIVLDEEFMSQDKFQLKKLNFGNDEDWIFSMTLKI